MKGQFNDNQSNYQGAPKRTLQNANALHQNSPMQKQPIENTRGSSMNAKVFQGIQCFYLTLQNPNIEVSVQPIELKVGATQGEPSPLGMVVQIKHTNGELERRLDVLTDKETRYIKQQSIEYAKTHGELAHTVELTKYYGEIYWGMIQ